MAPLLAEFASFLQQRHGSSTGAYTAALTANAWTLPDSKGALPPPEIKQPRAAEFPPPALRAQGDFVPASVHCLAAARLYPYCLSSEGWQATPMSMVLRMRLLGSLHFSDAPAILPATHSARWGRFGITVMHYLRTNEADQLRAGSTDVNFSLDFGANVTPRPAPECFSYHDILGALQGLSSFANAEWYEPMTRPLRRLRIFVVANMDADPMHTPRRFKAATRRIEFTSASRALALQATTVAEAPPARPALAAAQQSQPNTTQRVVLQDTNVKSSTSRSGRIPDHIRALIPHYADGEEPCLRFIAGSMCFGCTKAKCASSSRTHDWSERLPAALANFIKKKFGRRNTHNRRQAPNPNTNHSSTSLISSEPALVHAAHAVTHDVTFTSAHPTVDRGHMPVLTHITSAIPATIPSDTRSEGRLDLNPRAPPFSVHALYIAASVAGQHTTSAHERHLHDTEPTSHCARANPNRADRCNDERTSCTPVNGAVRLAETHLGDNLIAAMSTSTGDPSTQRSLGTLRSAPSDADLERLTSNGRLRLRMWGAIRRQTAAASFHRVGVQSPPATPPNTGQSDLYQLNNPYKQRWRNTCAAHPDYRLNKALIPQVIARQCQGYINLDGLISIAADGVRVRLIKPLPAQTRFPSNHPSASSRINVLRKNIRKEQDLFRCLVVDADLIDIWPEIHISPFGVVDKGDGDPRTTGRVIHDLSFPEHGSVNSSTDLTNIPKATFEHCSSVAHEIINCRHTHTRRGESNGRRCRSSISPRLHSQ
ncbi:hypothetical protein PHMEG_00016078 [Phytophthora megakarya]|uniref:Uncharacterized protein n=1 Tax=Phytophthora megakarya TaxID=4795 RepID=A0A225W278_9STRA|nr:hypothetical protein PHMEG_00016078 [Phytophthora megakarya]